MQLEDKIVQRNQKKGNVMHSDKIYIQSNLKQSVTVSFHTKYAINLIEGSKNRGPQKKHHITGLLSFASKLKIVKKDGELNNPYANYYLTKAIKLHSEALLKVSEISKYCSDEIASYEEIGFSIIVATNNNPTEKTFTFSVPLCYKIVLLLVEYDLCVRQLQSLFQTGFLTEEDFEKKINSMGQAMRRLFHSAEKYTSVPVTISDIQVNNERAIVAKKAMGDLKLAN